MSTVKPIIKVSPFAKASDTDLFIEMAQQNGQQSDEAFAEFHSRYKGYLYKCCLHVIKKINGDQSLIEDLVQNTFTKVYFKAGTYKPGIGIKAWLGTIATHELTDYFRKNGGISLIYLPYEEVNEKLDVEEEKESPPSFNQVRLENELSELSAQEKDILMTYMRYLDLQNPKKQLPANEMASLCSIYSTTPENIRQIKHRTLKKLKSKLS